MIAGLLEAMRVMPQRLSAADGSLPPDRDQRLPGCRQTTLLNELQRPRRGAAWRCWSTTSVASTSTPSWCARAPGHDQPGQRCVRCTVSSELTRTLIDLAQRRTAWRPSCSKPAVWPTARHRPGGLDNPALRLDGG